MHQRLGPGPHRDARLGERVQVLGRHVLVVEGDHLRAVGDLPQHLEVGVVADQRVRDDLGGRDPLGLGQQPQRDPERGGRLRQHPGQLSAADHGDAARLGHAQTLRWSSDQASVDASSLTGSGRSRAASKDHRTAATSGASAGGPEDGHGEITTGTTIAASRARDHVQHPLR